MKNIIVIAGLLLFLNQINAQVSQPYTVDFENHSPGTYTTAMVSSDFPAAEWYHGFEYERATIVIEEGNRVLRVKYPQGCLGPNYEEGCGIQIKWRLPETADTMWVSYKLKFEDGFDFRKGGKLAGLCGGKAYTGGNKPASKGDGWSARIMWRENGTAFQYMYYVEQAANYGDYWAWQENGTASRFRSGEWYTVTTQIILNTIHRGASQGNHDGIIRSWLNGNPVMEKTNLRLVDFENQSIDLFYFSTFHGGSSADWSPIRDSYIRYDDIIISKDPIFNESTSINVPHETTIFLSNSASGQLTVNAEKEIRLLEVYSVLGRKLIHTPENSINIQPLVPGIYLIQVTFQDDTRSGLRFRKS